MAFRTRLATNDNIDHLSTGEPVLEFHATLQKVYGGLLAAGLRDVGAKSVQWDLGSREVHRASGQEVEAARETIRRGNDCVRQALATLEVLLDRPCDGRERVSCSRGEFQTIKWLFGNPDEVVASTIRLRQEDTWRYADLIRKVLQEPAFQPESLDARWVWGTPEGPVLTNWGVYTRSPCEPDEDVDELPPEAATVPVADIALATEPMQQVAAPVFSHADGPLSKGEAVSLTCSTDGAEIRYTTDGSEPGPGSGIVYKEPIQFADPATVRAVACKAGMAPSRVAQASFAPAADRVLITTQRPRRRWRLWMLLGLVLAALLLLWLLRSCHGPVPYAMREERFGGEGFALAAYPLAGGARAEEFGGEGFGFSRHDLASRPADPPLGGEGPVAVEASTRRPEDTRPVPPLHGIDVVPLIGVTIGGKVAPHIPSVWEDVPGPSKMAEPTGSPATSQVPQDRGDGDPMRDPMVSVEPGASQPSEPFRQEHPQQPVQSGTNGDNAAEAPGPSSQPALNPSGRGPSSGVPTSAPVRPGATRTGPRGPVVTGTTQPVPPKPVPPGQRVSFPAAHAGPNSPVRPFAPAVRPRPVPPGEPVPPAAAAAPQDRPGEFERQWRMFGPENQPVRSRVVRKGEPAKVDAPFEPKPDWLEPGNIRQGFRFPIPAELQGKELTVDGDLPTKIKSWQKDGYAYVEWPKGVQGDLSIRGKLGEQEVFGISRRGPQVLWKGLPEGVSSCWYGVELPPGEKQRADDLEWEWVSGDAKPGSWTSEKVVGDDGSVHSMFMMPGADLPPEGVQVDVNLVDKASGYRLAPESSFRSRKVSQEEFQKLTEGNQE